LIGAIDQIKHFWSRTKYGRDIQSINDNQPNASKKGLKTPKW